MIHPRKQEPASSWPVGLYLAGIGGGLLLGLLLAQLTLRMNPHLADGWHDAGKGHR